MDKSSKTGSTERTRELEGRLQELNKRHGRDTPEDDKQARANRAGYGNAFRMSSEFISAILVGSAIGFGIDWLAGTTPWAMVLFLLLGFVAGVMNLLRVAGELPEQGKGYSKEPEDEK